MDIILSHNNLDCDGLASMLIMSRLRPGALPVFLGNQNRNVKDILARYEGILKPERLRSLGKRPIQRIILVDTQEIPNDEALQRRLAQEKPDIEIYDHHPLSSDRPAGAIVHSDPVGATATLLAEEMQRQGLAPTPAEATVLLLGVYEDTGHLTYTTTTPRDARIAAWLLDKGADLNAVADYINRPLSQRQVAVYQDLQADTTVTRISGYAILLAGAQAPEYVDEASTLAHMLTDTFEPDASFILVQMEDVVQIIARSRNEAIDVAAILKPLGGGGHQPAAAALVRGEDLAAVKGRLLAALRQGIAPAIVAGDIMTREVHSIAAGETIATAFDALRRYGHEALPIVADDRLVGLIMRRDAEKALHHGLGDRPVEAFATFDMPTISPRTSLIDIQDIMQHNNIGQLPVVETGRMVGIVTRTDVIRRWRGAAAPANLAERVRTAIAPDVFNLLGIAGRTASDMGFSLYLVGGFVRDMLLGLPSVDLDLVVEGDAIALSEQIAARYGGRTMSHTRFGTAKWMVSPADTKLGLARSLALDFVTARTEFYEHPAALPVVEAGSLRHDLYRRDFTVNTMAVCLNGPRYGELVDYYGGKADLDRRLIRVLHNLSFVDDATRILRAARLAQRLGCTIEERTRALIADAWDSLARVSGDRLRHEMKLIFAEAAPEHIIKQLGDLGVLAHLHPGLRYTPWLAEKYAALRAALPAWQAWGWGNGGSGGDAETALMASYLAILAYPLSESALLGFMARLNLAAEAGQMLRQAWKLRAEAPRLVAGLRPSQIYRLLHSYLVEAIAVVAIAEEAPAVREAIASYMQNLRHVRTGVDGETLKSLGVPPGPVYAQVLGGILDARLDGNVSTREEEERLLGALLAAAGSRQ